MGWRWHHDRAIARQIDAIEQKVDRIMSDLTALKAAAEQISTDVNEAIVALDDLAAKVAEGGGVAQTDIDAITAKLTTAGQALDVARSTDDPDTAPPAE